jgi:ElaB/YqjD/DUF883 family membrane-anchored ribosome-binding protein
MAEERNVAIARATETAAPAAVGEETTKAELQRRMEEARESITQTVAEIKDTVANQYQSVKETVTEALDWREQYRKRPVAFSAGAVGVGFVAGYAVAGALKGSGRDDDRPTASYSAYEEDYDTNASSRAAKYPAYEGSSRASKTLAGGTSEYAQAAAPRAQATPGESSGTDYSALYSKGYAADAAATSEAEEEDKPGLVERFKETRAYERLQSEVSALGDRFIDELSNVGQTVVLPMLFNKVKELFGVDLSGKKQQASGGAYASRGSSSQSAGRASFDSNASPGATQPSVAQSEPRSHSGSTTPDRDDYGRGSSSGAASGGGSGS